MSEIVEVNKETIEAHEREAVEEEIVEGEVVEEDGLFAGERIDSVEEQRIKLQAIAKSIRKAKKDDGIIMVYDEKNPFANVDVISTGSMPLDIALGVGGFPRGRITELYGKEGSGKSSVALSAVAEAQKLGLICAYIDVENAILPSWCENLGVDMSLLMLSQESITQEVFDLVDKFVTSGVGLIIVDSIAQMCPREEDEADYGKWTIGLNARLIGQGVRKLCQKIKDTNACIIFINQVRDDVNVVWGNPETTPGGSALKFASSVRLDVQPKRHMREGGDDNNQNPIIGIRMGVTVTKNKVAYPFKRCELDFYFNGGFDNDSAVINIALEKGVMLTKGGGWIIWPTRGDMTSKYKLGWVEYFNENPDEKEIFLAEVKEA